jgi:hypothetical protein
LSKLVGAPSLLITASPTNAISEVRSIAISELPIS